jgi:kinetochore protein Nuf2
MDVCGVVDFSVRDILRPEYQRTRKILSALINFEKFRQQQLQENGHIFQEQVSSINQPGSSSA